MNGEIVDTDFNTNDIGDSTALPGLLEKVYYPVDLFLGGGACDGDPTRDLLLERTG